MKYTSIDIETTGVDDEKDQILSIGLVIEDTLNIKPVDELPSLHLVIVRDRLEGNVFALNMNSKIIELLKEYQVSDDLQRAALAEAHGVRFVKEWDVAQEVFNFLYINNMVNPENYHSTEGYIQSYEGKLIPSVGTRGVKQTKLNVAGKNFGTFDKKFIERLPRWNDTFRFRQRILDPAILFINWLEDEELPNLNTCMKRAGVKGEVTHDAVADAKDVIKVLRTTYEVIEMEMH